MVRQDPRIDAYIANAADFAQPILRHLRALVHATCPEVEETMKWGMPHFLHHGMLCAMAAFKAHCAFGFWRGELIVPKRVEAAVMGQFGRITALSDLPSDKTLVDYLRKAMQLNERGIPVKAVKTAIPRVLELPDDFRAAMASEPEALRTFENFSPSQKREYLEWIIGAKRDATRQRRIVQAIEWLVEGKPRNWKYMNC